jgi:hypothetical protein
LPEIRFMTKRSLYPLLPILWTFLACVAAAPAWQGAPRSAKVWVDNPLEFGEFLETADIVSVEDVGSGRNQPKRVTLRSGARTHRAIWKPIQRGRQEWGWESYQAEVAAYELDRLLGLNMVPPTVIREIDDQRGSLQLWVEGCHLYEDVQDQVPQSDAWNRQVSRMRLFDGLIGNGDRNARNFMVDAAWNIVLIDHSQAFQSNEELDSAMLPERYDRELIEKMKGLEPTSLDVHFDRLLMRSQVTAIQARRDVLLTYVEKAASEHGETEVFY